MGRRRTEVKAQGLYQGVISISNVATGATVADCLGL